ncbi:MAG: restriction endonuclease subunit S [Helicobacteraceae bacterium]|jgi:type I restriction enzyme S subunit|nr:restriction endonuclease subunit S [Helicobacteraceae bacterium]
MSIEWFGILPERWEIKRSYSMFAENTATNEALVAKKPLQFRFGEIVAKKAIESDVHFFDSIKRYIIVEPNDIIINGLNLNYDFITQRCAIVKDNGCITPAYVLLRPRDTIVPMYACYLLKAMDGQKVINGLGTGIRLTLSYSEFKKINLPLPPLEEQDQIARYLDWKVSLINRLIAAKRRQIALLKEQKQAIINTAVTRGGNGWKKMKLRHICQINASILERLKLYESKTFVTFLPMEKISTDGKIDCSEKRKIQDVRSGFTSFAKNDVVVAKITPCFENGKGACLDSLETEIGFGTTELIVLRANEKVIPKYLYLITYSSSFRKQGEDSMTGSAGQKRVPVNFIANFQILLPTLDEQYKIIARLDEKCSAIDKVTVKLNDEIALFTEYRTRLISDVVTGKLDVRAVAIPKYEMAKENITADNDELFDDENIAEDEE